ncbi:MAG: hypothetical protein ACT4OO_12755, partial [Nitrospiraceae bacterium]
QSGGSTSQVTSFEIRTISAAIVETQVLEMHRTFELDRPVFSVKIRAVVDLDKLEEAVKRLKSDEQLATHYRQLQKENSRLRSQLRDLHAMPRSGTILQIEPTQTVRNRERAGELVRAAIQDQDLSHKINLASQATAIDDQYLEAYIVRGQTYLRIVSLAFSQKSPPEGSAIYIERASADFDQALKIDPASTWALLGRGDAFTWRKKTEAAADDYEHILQLDPLFDLARYRLIALYTTQARKQAAAKQWKAALMTLEKLLGAETAESWVAYQKEAYLLRGEIQLKLNQVQGAIDDFSTVIRVDPTNAKAFLLRAKLHDELMQGRLAKEDLERACALGSDVACQELP